MTDDRMHDGANLPQVLLDAARRVIDENREAGLRIAVAESCTGGLVSAALTEIPGCSEVFVAGFVTYANDAKMNTLGIASDVVETFGAVSVAVAWAMAQGAIQKTIRRYRRRDHRYRRARWRQREEARRHRRIRACEPFGRSRRRGGGQARVRRSRPRGHPASGGAVRARTAAARSAARRGRGVRARAVERCGARFERADHLAQARGRRPGPRASRTCAT